MKPKVALVKDGFLPAGSENTRGRLSLSAITRCKELAAEGWDIDGYSKPTVAVAPVAKTQDKVSKPATEFVGVADTPDEYRPESVWQAHANHGEKKVSIGMRTICNQCNNSLSYCHCRTPYVWLDFETEAAVSFSPLNK